MKPTEFDAVVSLAGGGVSSGLTDDGVFEYRYHNGQEAPTQAEIDAELKRLQDEYDNDYSRKRKEEYPSIQECIHAILDDDLDALQKKRAGIKKKYPKG